MVKVTDGDLSCWCDSLRTDSGLVFLSLFGNRNAVRSMWARTISRDRHRWITINGEFISLKESVRYQSISTPIGQQTHHMVLIHPDATLQVSPFSPLFFLVGDCPEKRYFARLNRMCPVPFRKEWEESIWKIGVAHDLISPLNGFGIPGYAIQTSGEEWSKVVIAAIKLGLLK